MRVLANRHAFTGSRFGREVSPPLAALLRANCQVRLYDQGEVMYRVGDVIPGPCIRDYGVVVDYYGDEPLLRNRGLIMWPNEICAISMAGETEWPVSLLALTPVVWVILPLQAYEELKSEHLGVFPALVQQIARQTYRDQCWAARLASVTLRPRVRIVIHRLVQELGTPCEGGTLLNFRVTHEVLATVARANRDEVGRAVRELSAQGLLVRQPNGRLLIPDVEALLEQVDS